MLYKNPKESLFIIEKLATITCLEMILKDLDRIAKLQINDPVAYEKVMTIDEWNRKTTGDLIRLSIIENKNEYEPLKNSILEINNGFENDKLHFGQKGMTPDDLIYNTDLFGGKENIEINVLIERIEELIEITNEETFEQSKFNN